MTIAIDEQTEREALVAWLRSEVARLGGDWVPSPQQVWIARAAQPPRVSREALTRALKNASHGTSTVSYYPHEVESALRALGIKIE